MTVMAMVTMSAAHVNVTLLIAGIGNVTAFLRNAENALDAAGDAADHATHDAADNSANRTGSTVTMIGAFLHTTANTLGLGSNWHGENGQQASGHRKAGLREFTGGL
jgi:hypothetical protein